MPTERQQSQQPQQSSGQGQGRELSRSSQGGGGLSRRGSHDPFSFSPAEFFQNPFSLMRRMHDEMDRVFADTFGGGLGRGSGDGGSLRAPAIELNQSDNQLKICAELPGLKQEDVQVEVIEDSLVIQGERKQEQESEEGGVRRSERRYGRFYRAIPLPEGAQVEKAEADFRDGVLEVTVPVQQPESKRRQIKVGSSQGNGRTIEASGQSSSKGGSQGGNSGEKAKAAAASRGGSPPLEPARRREASPRAPRSIPVPARPKERKPEPLQAPEPTLTSDQKKARSEKPTRAVNRFSTAAAAHHKAVAAVYSFDRCNV